MPSSSTNTVATFLSTTRLDNVSNSPITFENTPTSIHQAVTSGVQERTESNNSSSRPDTSEAKVSSRMIITSVGVIVGVSIAVLVLAIFGDVLLLVIRTRRKRTQKRATTDTSKRVTTLSNRGHNEDGECQNSHEGIAAISLPSLASDGVSTDTTYSTVDKGNRTKVTEQIPIMAFRNYSNYCNVQCAFSNEESAYDSTDLQTNHAVKEDAYVHTVRTVSSHAVIEDAYDHTVSTANSHAVIEDAYDHTVSTANSHAVIEDVYDHTVSTAYSHAVIEDTYDHTFRIDNSNTYN